MITMAVAGMVSLLAIWIGYPAVIALVAALRPAPRRVPPTGAETVSVVVASREPTAAIRTRVADILSTEYPADRVQLVIALDPARGSSDRDELAALDRRVVVVEGDAPGGKAATLNAGVRAATGDVLVFTDTYQEFERDTMGELVAALADREFALVSGSLELGREGGSSGLAEWYWRYERWLRRCEARVHSTVGAIGPICAMRRSLWTPLPAGVILDDVFTPMRLVLAGHRTGYATRARATDLRRFEAGQEYRRKVRTLTGVVQLCAWLPDVLVPFRNPIWLQFVFHKLLRLLTPYLALAVMIGVLGWAIPWAVRNPALGVAVLVVVAALSIIPATRRRLRRELRWGVALHAAVVTAAVNGVRGRWDVWR